MPTALGFELKAQCRSRLARLTLPVSVLQLALFAAPVLRPGQVIVRGVAKQLAKPMLMLIKSASMLQELSLIALPRQIFAGSLSVLALTLRSKTAFVLRTAPVLQTPLSMLPKFLRLGLSDSTSRRSLQTFSAAHLKAESLPISFCRAFSWQRPDQQWPPNRDRR